MLIKNKLVGLLQRFRDDEEASATIEFVILIPAVMWIVFSVMESGWLLTQKTMLDRGLALAVRDLRLGRNDEPTAENIIADICEYAAILRNCSTTLTLELVNLDNPIGNANAKCVDRAATDPIDPPVFNAGSHRNQHIMVARACYVMDPLIPGAGFGAALPKDASGGYHMVSYSAFANEPK